MATTQTEVRTKPPTTAKAQRATRRNEIVAIALFAVGLLIFLCLLLGYSYSPEDTSWNAAGQVVPRNNLIGAVGANVAAGLFQFFGLAAFSVPLLLWLMAWQRFRTRALNASFLSVLGLVVILLTVSALFDIMIAETLTVNPMDFRPGGFVGNLIASTLAGALNTVGASVLLFALAATGVLLVSNFSYARAYDRFVEAFGSPADFLKSLRQKFDAWRTKRREVAQARAAERQAARAERELAQAESLKLAEQSAAEMIAAAASSKTSQPAIAANAVARSAVVDERASKEELLRARIARAEAELAAERATILGQPLPDLPPVRQEEVAPATSARLASAQPDGEATPARRDISARVKLVEDDLSAAAEIEEMVSGASVVRTDVEDDEAHAAAAAKKDRASSSAAAAAERAARRAAERAAANNYKLPSHEFLTPPPPRHEQAEEVLRNLATQVAEKCREFNVTGKIEYICPGPVVTTYEFKPDPGVKYSRVTNLVDDLCLALKAESIRIDRVPGKAHVGIEVPNPERETIMLREVIESNKFRESTSKLTIALGKTIDGLNYVSDLAKMPHLLIAGATGAGKSVGVNSLIVSILYKASPDEVKFIMVDPKRLELGLYADIPHLATPIITDPKRAAHALKWAVAEMERRYKELAGWGVRNIDGYNAEVARRNAVEEFDEERNPWKPLPYIVIIIDELADLMMVSGHAVEEAITRLAQMARAVGIHLVLATQRPSVDVITGIIKSNFPSRISFRVSSKVDSRVIIDANGAEQLLGSGDMLFLPPGTSRLVRVHGAYVDETEIAKIVKHVKDQAAPLYDETITLSEEEVAGADGAGGERDELFDQALRICVEMKRASTSVLQRRLRIGYGRAAAILDAMEREGFIGQADGARPRPVLGRAIETVEQWDSVEADEG